MCPGVSSDLASGLLSGSIHLCLPCSLPVHLRFHFISRSCQPRPPPTSQVVPFSAADAVAHVSLPAFPRELLHGCPAACSWFPVLRLQTAALLAYPSAHVFQCLLIARMKTPAPAWARGALQGVALSLALVGFFATAHSPPHRQAPCLDPRSCP